jgi:hypothetical protein
MYELHYGVDRTYPGSSFPRSIGGGWWGKELGRKRYGPWIRSGHGTPFPTKVAVGLVVLGGVAALVYWLFSDTDDE